MTKEEKKDKVIEEPKEATQSFFFPDYGVSVEASDIEEATKKVKKLFNK